MAYEQLDLIEEVTRNDGSKYYEISNIDQNGIAELAVDRGLIKKVRILQLNLARTKSLQLYEEYINKTYQLETLTNEDDWKDPQWVEWEKPPKINQNKPNAEIVTICTSPYLLFSNCDKSTAAHEIQVRLTPSPT